MKKFFVQLFKDKNGNYSLRELVIALFVVALIASWVARQFFGKEVPEFMFYSFASLVGAGCFGYSIERKTTIEDNSTNNTTNNTTL
jgi:choline-glycine betaine transporter